MKKWIIRIALLVVLVVVVAVVVLFTNLNSIVKKGVETVGPQITKTEMRLARASISPLSGSGQLTGLFIGNPEGYKTESAIKVGDVKVVLKISSITSDTVEIESVNIQAPEITFEGGLGGNNMSKLLENVEAATGGDKPARKKEDKAAAGPGKKFRVKDVVMEGGKIHASLTGLGAAKTFDVSLPSIHLQNIGSEGSGVTAAQLTHELIKPLLAAATKAVTEAASHLGKEVKDLEKGALQELNKTTKGVKDLFNK